MLTSETPGEEASEAGGTARAGKGEVAQKEARSEAALRAYGERDADADARPVEGRALDRWADTEPPLGSGSRVVHKSVSWARLPVGAQLPAQATGSNARARAAASVKRAVIGRSRPRPASMWPASVTPDSISRGRGKPPTPGLGRTAGPRGAEDCASAAIEQALPSARATRARISIVSSWATTWELGQNAGFCCKRSRKMRLRPHNRYTSCACRQQAS